MRFLLLLILFLFSCKVQGYVFHEKLPGVKAKTNAEAAQILREKGFLVDAIEQYRKHIDYRLSKKPDLTNENPYFYLVIIGSIYLELNEIDLALESVEMAHKNKVDNTLIVDGILQITRRHISNSSFEKALELVSRYRDLDPLLFDVEQDRIHREMLYKEDFGEQIGDSPSN